MRRILRKVAADHEDEFGDISTLAEPSIVEEIIRNHKNIKNLDWKRLLRQMAFSKTAFAADFEDLTCNSDLHLGTNQF